MLWRRHSVDCCDWPEKRFVTSRFAGTYVKWVQRSHFVELEAACVLWKHDEPPLRHDLLSVVFHAPVVEASSLKGRKGSYWLHAASREQQSRRGTSGKRSEGDGWKTHGEPKRRMTWWIWRKENTNTIGGCLRFQRGSQASSAFPLPK